MELLSTFCETLIVLAFLRLGFSYARSLFVWVLGSLGGAFCDVTPCVLNLVFVFLVSLGLERTIIFALGLGLAGFF